MSATPRTMHRVVSSAMGKLAENVGRACKEAELEGMVLVGVYQVDEWNQVAAFVGAEELFTERAE